jgi:hypothetical protein
MTVCGDPSAGRPHSLRSAEARATWWRFAPFRSRSTPRSSPSFGRGVCLFFSSCPGSLTTMTGSNLAGHRLLGSARRAVLRTALRARRGGTGPPLNQPPPPGAPRLLPPPRGRAVQHDRPGWRDRRVSLQPVCWGASDLLRCGAATIEAVAPRGHCLPRGAWCGARCGARTAAGGGRRDTSRSRPAKIPGRKKRSGRRHERREGRGHGVERERNGVQRRRRDPRRPEGVRSAVCGPVRVFS